MCRYLFNTFATISNPPELALSLKRSAAPKLTNTRYRATSKNASPVNEVFSGRTISNTLKKIGNNNEV